MAKARVEESDNERWRSRHDRRCQAHDFAHVLKEREQRFDGLKFHKHAALEAANGRKLQQQVEQLCQLRKLQQTNRLHGLNCKLHNHSKRVVPVLQPVMQIRLAHALVQHLRKHLARIVIAVDNEELDNRLLANKAGPGQLTHCR